MTFREKLQGMKESLSRDELVQIAKGEHLSASRTDLFVKFMMKRFPTEGFASYAGEWARRFAKGSEWASADNESRSVLKKLNPGAYPETEYARKLESLHKESSAQQAIKEWDNESWYVVADEYSENRPAPGIHIIMVRAVPKKDGEPDEMHPKDEQEFEYKDKAKALAYFDKLVAKYKAKSTKKEGSEPRMLDAHEFVKHASDNGCSRCGLPAGHTVHHGKSVPHGESVKEALAKGSRVQATGAGRTKSWGAIKGTVTSVRSGKVFVKWDGTKFTEDEMEPSEVKELSERVSEALHAKGVHKGVPFEVHKDGEWYFIKVKGVQHDIDVKDPSKAVAAAKKIIEDGEDSIYENKLEKLHESVTKEAITGGYARADGLVKTASKAAYLKAARDMIHDLKEDGYTDLEAKSYLKALLYDEM